MGIESSSAFMFLIELLAFIGIVMTYLFITTYTDSTHKDINKLTGFLDKVDQETLFKLANIDERDENHRITISKNINEIQHIHKQCNKTIIHNDVRKISNEYMSIIRALEAIKTRENEKLKSELERLKRDKK